MALSAKSSFLYGYQITEFNRSIDFKANISDTSPRLATLNLGFYSLTSLMTEIVRAISVLDAVNTYTVTANRSVAGGTQNRITIWSSGTYFQLLFGTGPRAASSVASLIGFTPTDKTGFTTYTGNFSTGTQFTTTFPAYNYLGPDYYQKVMGAVNVSASGQKEAIVFNIQSFIQSEFKYERKADVETNWIPFFQWAIQQKRFEFIPEISSPGIYYEVTLEKTGADGKGLAFTLKEMLPQFPNVYQTGVLLFRKVQT